MAQNDATDIRTDSQKIKMADVFTQYESEYRSDEYRREIVHEDDECIILADGTGYELNEWADEFDMDREELRACFRELAEQKMDSEEAHQTFSYADPVVFDKFEDGE